MNEARDVICGKFVQVEVSAMNTKDFEDLFAAHEGRALGAAARHVTVNCLGQFHKTLVRGKSATRLSA